MGTEQQFAIRWRGRQEGPLSVEIIEGKLARGEIGLLHEVYAGGEWITLRDFFGKRETARQAARMAKEQEDRNRREEERSRQDQFAREAAALKEAQLRHAAREEHGLPAGTGAKDQTTALLEKIVLSALKPAYPKWAWFCLGGSLFLWLLSSAWVSSTDEEWRKFIQTCDEISAEMKSSNYQQEKVTEALVLALIGENPYRVLEQPLGTLKATRAEADRIRAEMRTARSATRVFLAISVILLGIAIWRHSAYNKALASLGYLTPKSPVGL